jgi:uncharacterized membrane protein YbhN (UPF0104 family)
LSPTRSPTDPGSRRGLSWKTRRRLALLVLVAGLPVYVVAAVTVVGWFDRPPLWLELLIYVGLGLLWALPLKRLFLGVGQADPDAPKQDPSRGE